MRQPIHCLLIDDDLDDKDFFNEALKSIDEKINFHHASTAADALDKLKSGEFKPHYIFLDLNMMPVNGLDCLKQIKKIARAVDIPVIIYSTSINEDIKYHTLEAGAFDHFEKPSDQATLVNYLKRVLQIKD